VREEEPPSEPSFSIPLDNSGEAPGYWVMNPILPE